MQDEVLAGSRGDGATGEGHEVGADGRRHQDTAAGDGQAGAGVERQRRGGIEAERIDRDRRGADGGQARVVDVGGGRVGGAVGGETADASAADGGEARTRVDGRPTTEDAGGVVDAAGLDGTRAHARGGDVEAGTKVTGDGAEVEIQGRRRAGYGHAGTTAQQGRAVESLRVGAGRLRRHRQRAAAEFERAGAVEDGRRCGGERVVIEGDRTAADRDGADEVGVLTRNEGEVAAADLDDARRAGADRADATPDETSEFSAGRTGQGQLEAVEVKNAASRIGIGDGGRVDGTDGDVAVELGDITRGVIEVQQHAGGGAVERVADVERIGVVEQERALDTRTGTDHIRISQVGVDAVETQDTASFLQEGARGLDEVAVRADASGEDDRVGVERAVGVILDTARDDDRSEVRSRGHIRVRVGHRQGGTEGRVDADEGDRAVTEDGPRIGDGRDFHGAERAVLADDRAATVVVRARGGRVEEDGTVTVVRRTAGEDHRGVAGDAVGVSEVGATAAESEGGLTVEDVGLESAREGQVLIRTEAHAREVGPTEVERLVGGRDAKGDRTDGPEGDLIQDGGLDAREVRDDGTEITELDRGRRTEVREAVETVAAGADVVGAGPAGVVAREVDGSVAPAGAGGEIEVAEEPGADGGLRARGADTRVSHQVERTSQGDIRTEADGTMESPRLTRTFFPAVADDVPVTGQGTGVVAHHELTTVITVDEDVTVGARTEGRAGSLIGDGSRIGDSGRLAERQGVTGDCIDNGSRRDTRTRYDVTHDCACRAGDGERRGGGGGRRRGRGRSGKPHPETANVSISGVGVVRAKHDVVTTRAHADETTEGHVGRTSLALAEDRVDGQGVAVGENDQLATESGHDGSAGDGRSAADGGTIQDAARGDGERAARGQGQRGAAGAGGHVTQGVDRLRAPTCAGVGFTEVDVVGDGVSLRRIGGRSRDADDESGGVRDADDRRAGRDARAGDRGADLHAGRAGDGDVSAADGGRASRQGLRVGRGGRGRINVDRSREPATGVLGGPIGDGGRTVGREDGVSRAVGVGEQGAGGTGRGQDTVGRGQGIVRITDVERTARITGDGAEVDQEVIGAVAGQDDIRGAGTDRGGGEDLRSGRAGAGEKETSTAVADVGKLERGQLTVDARGGGSAEDERGGSRDEVGRRRGVEAQLQGADLAGRTAGDAGSAGDDGGGAGIGLAHAVDLQVARTDLGEGARAGEDTRVDGVLTAVADAQVDGVAAIVHERDAEARGAQAADREGARRDRRVEDHAARGHHVRDVEGAVGQGVGVLEQDRAVDDGGVAREGVGAGKRQHAVADLGEAAGETFAAAARGGAVTDRTGKLDVVTVGVDERGTDQGDAAGDRARAGRDVGGGTGRPADGAALDGQTAGAEAVTGRDAVLKHLEGAAGVQDQAAAEGVRAGEGDGRADDVDAGVVAAGDVRSEVEDAAAAAKAEEAGLARRIGAGVGDVAHAGAETHAREVEAGAAEVDVSVRGRGRDGDRARARGVGEAIDLRERVRGVRHDGAALRDHEEAAGLITVEGGRVERAACADGDGAAVDRHGGGEGVDAGERERAEAGLDEATGGVGGIQGRDGHGRAGAAAARQGDGRDGARHVGAGAGDDDAGDLTVGDDRVTRGRSAARHEAGGAEGDRRSTDVAGAAVDDEVSLGDARARGGGESGQRDREAVGVDRDDTAAGGRSGHRGIVDRAEQRVGPEAVRHRDAIVRGDVRTCTDVRQRRQDARRHRGVRPERATREIIVADVSAARGHVDRGVVAQDHRARQLVIESGGSRDAAVTIAQTAVAAIEDAARDIEHALGAGTVEDEADFAGGVLTVDEASRTYGELADTLVADDEPIAAEVGVVQHARAADETDTDTACVVLGDVEAVHARARRHLIQAAGQVEVSVADIRDVVIASAAYSEETDGTRGLVVDRDGADGIAAAHGEQVDVAADVDDALEGAGTVEEVALADGTEQLAGDVQRAAVDVRVTGEGIAAGQGQGTGADLGQGERDDAAVADRAVEDGAGVVTTDREGDARDRVGVLDDAVACEASDRVVETVETEDALSGALRREDVRGIRAEAVRGPGNEHHAGEAGRTGVGIDTRKEERVSGGSGDEQVVARGAGDGSGDGERGTIGAGAGDGPGLRGAEDDRGADQDRAGVVFDGDTGRGDGRSDGERGGGLRSALGDGDAGDARRGRSETQRADGEVAVEGGDVGRGRRARGGAEDEVVRDAGEALGVGRAGGVGREVGVEVTVIERGPAHVRADAPVEVGRQGRRGQADGGVRAAEREGVAAEGAEVAEGIRRAREAAGGGDQVIRARGEAADARQVEDDAIGGDGRGRRADAVESGESADVETERGGARGAGAEVQRAGAEVDGLADGVVEVKDRARADADGGGAERGGASAGDIEAAAEDGRLADVGERRSRKGERTDPVLDETDVVLVGADAADGTVIIGEDILVDGEVGDGRGAADDGVVGDAAQTTDEDRRGVTAAARDGDDRREAGTVETGVGDRDAGDDTCGDRRDGLRSLGAHETADGVEGDDRRRGEGLTRIEDGDVRGLHAGDTGERGDGLVAGAVGVTQLEHGVAATGTDEEIRGRREAVIGAAGQDEAAVGHRRSTGEGVDTRQGERTRAGLGETAGADARGSADGTRQGEVVGGDVDRSAGGKQADFTGRKIVGEARQEAQGAAGETDDTGVAADVIEIRDGEDAFVDGGAESGAAAGNVRAGEHEGAAAGLGDVTGRGERRGDRRGEARRDRGGRRVDDVEEVFVRGGSVRSDARKENTAVEAAEGDGVLGGGRRRRVQGEEESAAAERQVGAGGAGDVEGSGRQAGVVIVQDEGVDRGARRHGEITRQHFTDVDPVTDGGIDQVARGEGRVVGGEIEGVEAGRGDIAHQRVAHVRLGDGAVDVTVLLADEPGRDALVERPGPEGERAAIGGRRGAQGERGGADDGGHGRTRGDTGAGDRHADGDSGGGGHVQSGAARGGDAGREADVGARAAQHRVDEVGLARADDLPARGVGIARRAAEGTAADVAGGEIIAEVTRGAELLRRIARDQHRQVIRTRIEEDVADILGARASPTRGVTHEQAERQGAGEVGATDEVAARTGGGVQADRDRVTDAVGRGVDVTLEIQDAETIDEDRREAAGRQSHVDTTAAVAAARIDAQDTGVDDGVAVRTADVLQRQGAVADEAQVTQAHELAVEGGVGRLVDGERGAEAEVDEVVVEVRLAIAARERADGLTIERGSLDRRDRGGVHERELAHDEALTRVDAQRAGSGGRGDGAAGEDESTGLAGEVHRDDAGGVEFGADIGAGDRQDVAGFDAVVHVGRDDGHGLGGQIDGAVLGGVGAQDDRVTQDAGDEGVGRDVRTADRLTDDQAGGAGHGDGVAARDEGRAGDRDRADGSEAAVELEADDAGGRVDAVTVEHLTDGKALDAVYLDDRRADGGGADRTGEGQAVAQHAQVGRVLIGEDDRREVADGEGAAAGAAEFEHARLELDDAAEIVGLVAGAEREGSVAGLGQALRAVDRGGDEQSLGRIERVGIAGDVGMPAEGVVGEDEFAGGRTQRAALDDADRAGGEGRAGSGRRGAGVDLQGRGVDDPGDAGAARETGAGDRHADEKAGGAADGDVRRALDRRGARQRDRGSRGGRGLEDTTRDELDDATVRNGEQRRTRRVEADRHRRDDVQEGTGVTADVGDVLGVQDAGEGVAVGHRDGHDVGADAGGEARGARGGGDGSRRTEGTDESGEEVVGGGGRDAVDGALGARRQREADGAGETLGDRSEVQDQVTSVGGEKIDGGIRPRVTGRRIRKDEPRDGLADVQRRAAQKADAATTQVHDPHGVNTIAGRDAGGRGIVKDGQARVEAVGHRAF